MLLRKSKMQYLLTRKVSRYCLLSLHNCMDRAISSFISIRSVFCITLSQFRTFVVSYFHSFVSPFSILYQSAVMRWLFLFHISQFYIFLFTLFFYSSCYILSLVCTFFSQFCTLKFLLLFNFVAFYLL